MAAASSTDTPLVVGSETDCTCGVEVYTLSGKGSLSFRGLGLSSRVSGFRDLGYQGFRDSGI
jgi:hypothetical protein